MSYTGEITETAVVAAVGIGVVAVSALAAATVGAAKAVGAVGKAVNSAVQTAKFHSMQRELGQVTAGMEALDDQLSNAMEAATTECYEAYEQTVHALEADYRTKPDTGAFIAACVTARDTLDASLAEKRDTLERQYIEQIRREAQTRTNELHALQRQIEQSMQRVADDMARKEQAKALAQQTLAEAASMLEDLQTRFGECVCGQQAVACCQGLWEKAKGHLDSGLYEAALTDAFAVRDTLMLRVQELMTAECRNRQRFIDAQALLTSADALLAANRSVTYEFTETRNGQPLMQEISDFTVYYRGAFAAQEQALQTIRQQLASADFRDFSPEALDDALRALNRWQANFLQETQTAYARLHNELLRRETCKLLAARYVKKGYLPLPLTAADKALSPLDSLVLRLEHSETGEHLYLRFNAVSDANGQIAMNIELEDHTAYHGTDAAIEQARQQEREANCQLIANSPIGKQRQMRQRCKNPGVLDTYQRPHQ